MFFDNQVTLITGAAQGIGAAIAETFAREGATIILNDINCNKVKEITQYLNEKYKSNNWYYVADVGDRDTIKKMVEEVIRKYKKIDILVNNAGICPKKNGKMISIFDIEEDMWEKVIKVNLNGTFYCSKYVIKEMIKNRFGKIINITSVTAKVGTSAPSGYRYGYPGPASAFYAASKAGIIALTKCLATELAPYGINVNAVAPGRIETSLAKETNPSVNKAMLEKIPLGKFGVPEDVANAVKYLASDEAKYITGEILDVNGGSYMD